MTKPPVIYDRRAFTFPPSLAVSGKLELTLVGCQNLLQEIQGRAQRSELINNDYPDSKGKGAKNMKRQAR